jgi:hypothetical protein
MKYVMFQVTFVEGKREELLKIPVIFPSHLVHSMVASAMLKSIQRHYPGRKVEPVSAGEVRACDLSKANGRSDTLNLESDPEDGVIMDTYDYTHGLV